jgi:hypothetical protein
MPPYRRPPPPWDGRSRFPRRPVGPARRRPRGYETRIVPEGAVQSQRRAGADEGVRERKRRTFRPRSLADLRQSPIRNGLIGLAVVGTAAPLAIHKHQQALRTDPSHEAIRTQGGEGTADDASVSAAWQDMENEETTAANLREASISESIERFSEYGLDRQLAARIYDAALENDIDAETAFGLIRAESSFKNTATSPVGAVGLAQLMPRTAAWLVPGTTVADLRNPDTNLRIGFKYLRSLVDKYEGDMNLALLAYNRGPGTVDRELRRGGNPDNGYADFVYGREGHGHTLYTNR